MKHKSIHLLLLSVFLALLSERSRADDIYSVAVFDFESKDELFRDAGPKISSVIASTLSQQPNLIMVERADLEKVLSEPEFGLSGGISPNSAANVGNLTGAKILVTGRVFKDNKEILLAAKIIGSETSRVYGEIVRGDANASISSLSNEMAQKIAAVLKQHGQTLVSKRAPLEDRVASIKEQVRNKQLPKVSVKIEERHYGQPANDPAAETEFAKVLEQCGFKLVDPTVSAAEIEILGEAFSAAGLRKGNLHSCKARVEIKAHKKDNTLLVDRQTSVAIDIAEQIAAKTALASAALEIALRLIPQLAD